MLISPILPEPLSAIPLLFSHLLPTCSLPQPLPLLQVNCAQPVCCLCCLTVSGTLLAPSLHALGWPPSLPSQQSRLPPLTFAAVPLMYPQLCCELLRRVVLLVTPCCSHLVLFAMQHTLLLVMHTLLRYVTVPVASPVALQCTAAIALCIARPICPLPPHSLQLRRRRRRPGGTARPRRFPPRTQHHPVPFPRILPSCNPRRRPRRHLPKKRRPVRRILLYSSHCRHYPPPHLRHLICRRLRFWQAPRQHLYYRHRFFVTNFATLDRLLDHAHRAPHQSTARTSLLLRVTNMS
jgi:hypothetical protein